MPPSAWTQPVLAVVLLFPITPETEAARKEEQAEHERAGAAAPPPPPDLFYMRQTIGNACGTIALLHCLGNSRDVLPMRERPPCWAGDGSGGGPADRPRRPLNARPRVLPSPARPPTTRPSTPQAPGRFCSSFSTRPRP